jgi:putative ABC transport system ATP-binding protein
MHELNRIEGTTFLFSSHDPKIIERATRVFHLADGRLLEEAVSPGR